MQRSQIGTVVHAYRAAMNAYACDPEKFDPSSFMDELNRLETRGYTTAFFDGALGPDAHNYETTRSTSVWHAAGVITAVTPECVTLELRNEITWGDKITFIMPSKTNGVSVLLPEIINAQTGAHLPKMSAGQHNSLVIPRAWFGDVDYAAFVPYILAYKHK